MTKRMLIDATHAEETRVVVLDGSRLEDFDVEISTKKQLKGNIYLAKVVRVEPSLQAAFVEYGGNRHGFLAFGEIHPDYYQIPVADRQRLLAMEAEDARREAEEEDRAALRSAATAPLGAVIPDVVASDASPSDVIPPDVVAMADHASDDDEAAGELASMDTASSGEVDTAGEVDTVDSASALPAAIRPVERAPVPGAAAPVAPSRAQAARIEIESVSGAFDAQDGLPDPMVLGVPAASASQDLAEPAAEPEIVATIGEEPAADSAAPDLLTANPLEAATRDAFDTVADAGDPDRDVESADADPGNTDPGDAELSHTDPGDAELSHTDPADADPRDVDLRDGEDSGDPDGEEMVEAPPPETVGGDPDTAEDARERRIPPRFLRNYKIQEVIRRRQILLVQVVKEERGTKGAALTTYISLAGRFCVLMPNSPRGGGISRKITSPTDRRRLKEVTAELDIPDGMGLIVRTAGANRPKPEIKRDCEYLMRLWDDIREQTMKSVAPALIYEEASLIKRAIRDVYSRDIDEILIDGEEGWKSARDFMRMLMPSHVKKVQLWRDPQPLFSRQQVEAQLDAMLLPTVQLRSGGYLVINQTEALVAIDVNSGRSTRERGIEETALRTNCEAVDEVARQLRLRDLAGLVVIDLIDMESRKNNATVERRLKEALKADRARIQVGHISHFGLMEMSRQRLRPSLAETSFVTCPHCGGTGHVRGTESAAIHVLRDIEEEGAKRRAAEILVRVALPIAMYVLNHKRDRLAEIEARYAMHVNLATDDSLIPPQIRIERVRPQVVSEAPAVVTPDVRPEPELLVPSDAWADDDVPVEDDGAEAEGMPGEIDRDDGQDAGREATPGANGEGETAEERERRRRRRRRRRGGRREEGASVPIAPTTSDAPQAESPSALHAELGSEDDSLLAADLEQHIEGVPEHADPGFDNGMADDAARGRRRGRRGGRRRRRDGSEGGLEPTAEPGAEQPDLSPFYTGPTPANPFGGEVFDIFDAIDQAERRAEGPTAAAPELAPEPRPISEPMPEPMPEALSVAPWHADAAPAEEAVVARPDTLAKPVPEPVPEPVSVAPQRPDADPAAEAVVAQPGALAEPVPEPVPEPVSVAPQYVDAGPVAETLVADPEPEVAAADPVATAPAPLVPANDVAPEPLVKPIVIGGLEDTPEVTKKRGWWRR